MSTTLIKWEYHLITVHANKKNIYTILVRKVFILKKPPVKKVYSDLVGLEISLDIKLM